MFPKNYFAIVYFAPRYFPPIDGAMFVPAEIHSIGKLVNMGTVLGRF
jgi:hypothetical protein